MYDMNTYGIGKAQCKIEDGKIMACSRDRIYYNPFDFYGNNKKNSLYIQFANINYHDENDILRFIENFGFLGINRHTNIESIPEIICEIKTLRNAISLLEAIDKLEIDNIIKYSLDIESELEKTASTGFDAQLFLEDSERLKRKKEYDLIIFDAKVNIQALVNSKLNEIHPSIELSGKSLEFVGTWVYPTLLSSMYLMFCWDITKKKLMRKCERKNCNKLFVIDSDDTRKIYCDTNCAKAEAQRKYRERAKTKELPKG